MLDGDTVYGARAARHCPTIPPERGAEWCVAMYWQGTGLAPDTATMAPADPGTEVATYVNQGRWVTECPDCAGAQLTVFADPRFICNGCGNDAVGNRWRVVTLPSPEDRAAIEAALALRPEGNQNWRPGEPVGLLHEETAAHEGTAL